MSNQVMNVSPVGEDAIEYLNRLLTEEEQQEVEIAVMLMQTVRPERKARRLSQAELGRLCGVTASTISLIENGDLTPSLTVVAKVLSVLGKRLYIGNMT